MRESAPAITVVYVHVCGDPLYAEKATRFSQSYAKFPPGYEHRMIVVCNKGNPNQNVQGLFRGLGKHEYFVHDNSGWDVGAFRAVSRMLLSDLMVCFGSHVYFHRAGWLKRLAEAWTKYGSGMYGFFSSHAVRPHLNTTAFAVSPELLANYTGCLQTKQERYQFEHGPSSFWACLAASGYPTPLLTWDGEWPPSLWRLPANIMWRGDQSNCLVWSNHCQAYTQASRTLRLRMEQLADDNLRAPPLVLRAPLA